MDCEMDELSTVAHRDIRATIEALERVTRERDSARADVAKLTGWAERAVALANQRDELVRERDEARADAARLREALTTIERTGAPGATIVAQRSDGHSCSWCRGMVTPCPVITAREALKGGGK